MPIVLLLSIGLAGCVPSVSVRPPTAAELGRVEAHQLAVVLFQLTGSIDGKPISPLNPGDSNNSHRIYLANLDELEAPRPIRPASPSTEAAAEGWRYLMLPPGVYYLLVLPPGLEQNPPAAAYHAGSARYGRLTQYRFEPNRGGFWSPDLMAFVLSGPPPADFREIQGFWFQVPESAQVVYLGALSTECTSGRGLLGSLIDSCSDYASRSDPQSASLAAGSVLPGKRVDALPLVPYGRPREETRLHELGGMTVMARAPTEITAAFTGAAMAPWGVIHGTGRAIYAYNLLAVGRELAARAGAERRAEGRSAEIQPCIDRLSGTVGAIDYSSRFVPAFAEAARSQGIVLELTSAPEGTRSAGSESPRYRLTTSLPILGLREVGEPGEMALELALAVRLEAIDSKTVRYYGILYYAPELPIQSPLVPRSPLYARFVTPRAKARPTSEWCGADGAALLAEEVSVALAHIAAQLVHDLD